MGESVAEKESVESSEFARQYSREGHEVLSDYAEDYAADPLLASIMAAGEQAGQQPLTYTPELKASMKANAFADLARRDAFQQSSQAQMHDQLGLGRSEAGGVGMGNQLRMKGLSDRMKAATQVEMQAAAQNQQDMLNAAMGDLGLIQAQYGPMQEQAAALLGSFNQLGPAISATGSHSGPIDFTGGLANMAAGAAMGSLFAPAAAVTPAASGFGAGGVSGGYGASGMGMGVSSPGSGMLGG